MKIRLYYFLIIICSIFLTGCNGAQETDQVAYVLAVGVDKSPIKGKIVVTYQIAIPSSLNKSGGKASDEPSAIVSITAVNLAEARNLLKSQMARYPDLSHIKAFIIGEEFARQGAGMLLGPIIRFREFRGTMYILVVKDGTAQEFINSNKPRLEVLPTRYLETMMLTAAETGYFRPTPLHKFYISLKTGSSSPIAALVGINPLSNNTRPAKEKSSPGEKVEEYYAGDISRTSESNPVEFCGTAVFKHEKLVGFLTNEETRMLAILQNDFPSGYIIVEDPYAPTKNVNLNSRLGGKPKIDIKLVQNKLHIDISILIEGEVTSIASGINYEAEKNRVVLENAYDELVKNQIIKFLTLTQSLGTDVVGFSYMARPLFPTYGEYKKADWESLYKNAEFKVAVKTKIRRTSLMWRSSKTSN